MFVDPGYLKVNIVHVLEIEDLHFSTDGIFAYFFYYTTQAVERSKKTEHCEEKFKYFIIIFLFYKD